MSDLLASGVLPLALISPLLTHSSPRQKKNPDNRQKRARDVLKERDRRFWIALLSWRFSEQINKIKSFLDQENKAIEQDMDSTEDSWLGADVENLKQLDNILNHYLPSGLTQAVEQIINLKNQEEAITTVERQLAAAPPEAYEKLADAVNTRKLN